jgi:hypothetical protein
MSVLVVVFFRRKIVNLTGEGSWECKPMTLFKIDTEGDKWSVLGGSHDISRSTMCRTQLWR